MNDAIKQKIRIASKKAWDNPERRKKASEFLKGNQHTKGHQLSVEHRSKISRSLLNAYHSGKRIAWDKGKKLSLEHRQKLSEKGNGRMVSIETRKKISDAEKGKYVSIETRQKNSINGKKLTGKNNPFFKKHHTQESKERNRRAHLGLNNYNWQGGISKLPYAFDFNKELKLWIKKRDKYICQLCQNEKNLCVHHIDYNKINSAPENLITLCRSCNFKVNSRRKYWTKFFNQRLKLKIA